MTKREPLIDLLIQNFELIRISLFKFHKLMAFEGRNRGFYCSPNTHRPVERKVLGL